MVGKSDRSVRKWRTDMLANDGVLPDSKQGKYQRNGVLWQDEELNEKARQYVRVNSSVKGQPNICLLYTSPSPRDKRQSRMPSSA